VGGTHVASTPSGVQSELVRVVGIRGGNWTDPAATPTVAVRWLWERREGDLKYRRGLVKIFARLTVFVGLTLRAHAQCRSQA
jgi:hypothetical protein